MLFADQERYLGFNKKQVKTGDKATLINQVWLWGFWMAHFKLFNAPACIDVAYCETSKGNFNEIDYYVHFNQI